MKNFNFSIQTKSKAQSLIRLCFLGTELTKIDLILSNVLYTKINFYKIKQNEKNVLKDTTNFVKMFNTNV